MPWEFRFGTRSWLVPGAIALLFRGADAIGFTTPALYLGLLEVAACLLSLSLPAAAWVIGSRLGGPGAGLVAFAANALWHENIYYAARPLSGVLASYLLTPSVALALTPPRRWKFATLGAALALCAAVRIQLAPAGALVFGFAAWRWGRPAWAPLAASAGAVVLGVGALDAWTWGAPFASHVNNVVYNLHYGIAESFGSRPFFWYLRALSAASFGLLLAATVWVLLRPRRLGLVWAVVAAVWLVHSCIAHKEYRFVYPLVPLVLTGVSVLLCEQLAKVRAAPLRRALGAVVATLVLGISALGGAQQLPRQRLAFRPAAPASQDARRAYHALAERPGVVAVLDAVDTWEWSGGYAHLHRDVPLYHARLRGDGDGWSGARLLPFVSHVIAPSQLAVPLPGFEPIARIGAVRIYGRRADAPPPRADPQFTRQLRQPQIDGRVTPNVRPRW